MLNVATLMKGEGATAIVRATRGEGVKKQTGQQMARRDERASFALGDEVASLGGRAQSQRASTLRAADVLPHVPCANVQDFEGIRVDPEEDGFLDRSRPLP